MDFLFPTCNVLQTGAITTPAGARTTRSWRFPVKLCLLNVTMFPFRLAQRGESGSALSIVSLVGGMQDLHLPARAGMAPASSAASRSGAELGEGIPFSTVRHRAWSLQRPGYRRKHLHRLG